MMLRNCSGVCSCDWAVTVALMRWPGAAGWAPIWPAETCTFCAWTAANTSDGCRL